MRLALPIGAALAAAALALPARALDAAAPRASRPDGADERGAQGTPGAQDPSLPDPTLAGGAQERARRTAIDAALAWLAARQAEDTDGSFPRGAAREWAPIGVTALGALAFLATGNSPGRGPYGAETALSVDYLLAHADLAEGSKEHGYISSQADPLSRMHGHGFATLVLAEAYGMGPRNTRLERALAAAVACIERSQSPEGGWHYAPRPINHEGSVTICVVQALRAARNAGLKVDPAVVARAEDYVLALKNDEGFFRYQLDREDASIALTAAGIATLNAAGRYDDATIREGVDAIWRGLARRDQDRGTSEWPFYERLYLAQALYQLQDRAEFDRWFEAESRAILRAQEPDGRWIDPRYGDVYATAVNVLVLSLPDGLLPIFQR